MLTSTRRAGIGASSALILPSLSNVSLAACGSKGPTVAVSPEVKSENAGRENTSCNGSLVAGPAFDVVASLGVPWMSHSISLVPGGSVSSELLDNALARVGHSL